MKKHFLTILPVLFSWGILQSQSILSREAGVNTILFAESGVSIDLVTDKLTDPIVKNAMLILQEDLKLTGLKPNLKSSDKIQSGSALIITGTIEDPLIKSILARKKWNPDIEGKWEHYYIKRVEKPLPGVKEALMVIGSDPRGTAFGILEISKQMGVSPWNWWADVPVKAIDKLYINKSIVLQDGPVVMYRGIFINDEAPALSNWSKEKFGGFNHQFYEKVFTLMLRLKANYIWPAMWGNAFYDDDPKNIEMAKKYGIVIGTSHHEPLMRAHDEWRRYGQNSAWNYDKNPVQLQEFWKTGMQRADNEKIVTVGMRGDGDEPMTEDVAIDLLKRIIADQRTIISEVSGKPANATPQIWALYKEVQEYYDKGMDVPEDITLLYCDDNWGNVRRLPKRNAAPRKGGYGIYYHFDYVGGPRNYKWLNTNYIPRIWDQMMFSYQNGVDRLWIVNVGDIKPMELPISFFLDMAWNPDSFRYEDIEKYLYDWAATQFGSELNEPIGKLLMKSSKLISLRKPELIRSNTFRQDEFAQIIAQFEQLHQEAEQINSLLQANYHSAFYQLVHHPIEAVLNLYKMYQAQAINHQAYTQKSKQANLYAEQVAHYFRQDSIITEKYHALSGGKWNHMMSQTHIGYTYWQQPPKQIMPSVYRLFDWECTHADLIDQAGQSGAYKILDLNGAIQHNPVKNVNWTYLPQFGRYETAITTWPMNHASFADTQSAPFVEFEFTTDTSEHDFSQLYLYHAPTLSVFDQNGLRIAVSVNGSPPEIIAVNSGTENLQTWEKWVADNIIQTQVSLTYLQNGINKVKIFHLDPGIILQRAMLTTDKFKPGLLGPEPFKNLR